MQERIVYSTFNTPLGEMLAACSDKGLCRLCLPGGTGEQFFSWVSKHFSRPLIEEGKSPLLRKVEEQVNQYLNGERTTFSVQLDLRGTPFQRRVWNALLQIPYGCTATYKDIACTAGSPGAARAVGQANNRNPIPIIVPCHRVIGSNGSLTGYGGGMHIKEWLLKLEGIELGRDS